MVVGGGEMGEGGGNIYNFYILQNKSSSSLEKSLEKKVLNSLMIGRRNSNNNNRNCIQIIRILLKKSWEYRWALASVSFFSSAFFFQIVIRQFSIEIPL